MHNAAVVHQGKLFLTGLARMGKDDMRILDSQTHCWSILFLDITPPACRDVLLDAYDGQLIQFGGKTGSDCDFIRQTGDVECAICVGKLADSKLVTASCWA